MNKPTHKQIEEAKEYLRKRLSAENRFSSILLDKIISAAKQIIEISYRYGIPASQFRFSSNSKLKKEVDEIIRKLKDDLIQNIDTYSVPEKENEEKILIYIHRNTHGKTFNERLATYADRYKYEIESLIAAGLLLNITKDKLLSSIKGNLRNPYSNAYFIKASQKGAVSATRLKTGGISYGVGRTNSAFTGIDKLTKFAISEGYMENLKMEAKKNGLSGFYSMRGSSYPCQLCDDMVGFHPSWDEIPPYHLNCYCFIIPL